MNVIKDSNTTHWVNRSPESLRPYLQLSRLDRPIGYWLLALPGWIGLAFATLSHGFAYTDLKWAALILIGAIAMRGAGCTYNDIVDQDLDAKVERTALRPLPAGTITSKQAWIWLFAQCGVGLIVLLCLPRLAQIISLCSIPLVAAYPFMKRITWWPQVWLGFTFNWAVLVAYAAKTESREFPSESIFEFILMNPVLLILYIGLIFWTIGYDTVYACQDIEDDAVIGIKSTARRFGGQVKLGVWVCYIISLLFVGTAIFLTEANQAIYEQIATTSNWSSLISHVRVPYPWFIYLLTFLPFGAHLLWQVSKFEPNDPNASLRIFKTNRLAGIILTISALSALYIFSNFLDVTQYWDDFRANERELERTIPESLLDTSPHRD